MEGALISTKGQVVIPQRMRERYRLRPNTLAAWVDLGGVLLLVPQQKDPVGWSRGILKKSRLTQAALKRERRSSREHS